MEQNKQFDIRLYYLLCSPSTFCWLRAWIEYRFRFRYSFIYQGIPRPRDSEGIFLVFESSCHLLLPTCELAGRPVRLLCQALNGIASTFEWLDW